MYKREGLGSRNQTGWLVGWKGGHVGGSSGEGSRVGLQHEKGGGCREEDRHGIEAQGQACQRRDGSASSLLTAFFLHLYNGDAQSR